MYGFIIYDQVAIIHLVNGKPEKKTRHVKIKVLI